MRTTDILHSVDVQAPKLVGWLVCFSVFDIFWLHKCAAFQGVPWWPSFSCAICCQRSCYPAGCSIVGAGRPDVISTVSNWCLYCLCNVFTPVLPETWSGCRGPEFGLPTMVTRHCIASVFLLGGTVVWKNHERTVKGRKKKDSSVWNRNYVPTWDVHVVHVMLVRKAKQGASCLIPQSS